MMMKMDATTEKFMMTLPSGSTVAVVNAQHEHRKHPGAFWVPGQAELCGLSAGMYVKAIFSEPDWAAERMWVRVTAVRAGMVIGVLESAPCNMDVLDVFDSVEFPIEAVIEVVGTYAEFDQRAQLDA